MDNFAHAVIASFDSSQQLSWDVLGTSRAQATFEHQRQAVHVIFENTGVNWQVVFSTNEGADPVQVLPILSGVFQAVKEFLEVRQPEKLTFTTKSEPIGRLYASYISRKETELYALGYRPGDVVEASPSVEFTLIKMTPSEWVQ